MAVILDRQIENIVSRSFDRIDGKVRISLALVREVRRRDLRIFKSREADRTCKINCLIFHGVSSSPERRRKNPD